MKILKNLIWLLLICGVIAIGRLIYFASQFSAVYPPIEKYDYSQGYSEFLQDLKTVSSRNPEIIYSVTDTTGGRSKGYSYYIIVNTTFRNTDNEYRIAYKTEEDWFGNEKNKIYLIGAFDRLNKLGGYKMKEEGVKDLVNAFENDLMNNLSRKNTSP